MATWYYPGNEPDTSFNDGVTDTGWAPQSNNYGAAIDLPAGTVTQLGVFVGTSDGFGPINAKLGLYTSGGNLVVQSSPVSIPDGSTLTWRSADVADTPISAATYYVLVSAEGQHMDYGYDTAGNGASATQTYAASMAASVTFIPENGARYGVRAEVEEGSSPGSGSDSTKAGLSDESSNLITVGVIEETN